MQAKQTLYYLIHDNSTQWFQKIAKTISIKDDIANTEEKTEEIIDLDIAIYGEYISSICSRELHFTSRFFGNDTYCGWTISEQEYERIKRLQEVYKAFKEYNDLRKLP